MPSISFLNVIGCSSTTTHYTHNFHNVSGAMPSGVRTRIQQMTSTWGKQQPTVWGQPTQQPVTSMQYMAGGKYTQFNPPTTHLYLVLP